MSTRLHQNAWLTRLSDYYEPLCLAYSELFFIESWPCGLLILIGTFIDFNIAIAGLISGICSLAFGHFLGLRKKFQWSGFYLYNPILSGMAVGYMFRIDWVCLPLLLTAALLTFMLTVAINHVFSFISVPVLSLPFSLASILLALAGRSYSELYNVQVYHVAFSNQFQQSLAPEAVGFFQALATILYTPNFFLGLGIGIIILSKSRLLFLTMVYGFLLGTGTRALMHGSWDHVLSDGASFNYAFAAAAVGATFLIPSVTSWVLASVAVVFSAVIADSLKTLLGPLQLSVFSLPFNLAVFFIVHTSRYFQLSCVTRFFGDTPEATLETYLSKKQRFGYPFISIALPTVGKWLVEQGFDGKDTHCGSWRYALDFAKVDADGKKFANQGLELDDHFTFGEKVVAPCRGYVVAMDMTHPDNLIGQLNAKDNWGNFLLIRHESGYYILLCHLKKDSAAVAIGQYVYQGEQLAQCGNSGYSAEPHLHLHMQMGIALGSPTVPFRLAAYVDKNLVNFNALPTAGSHVEDLPLNRSLDYAFAWPSGRKFVFARQDSEGKERQETVQVVIDSLLGKSCLEDEQGNRAYFWQEYPVFYFYDYQGRSNTLLAKIFMAMPRVVQSFGREFQWQDDYPLRLRYRMVDLILRQLTLLTGAKLPRAGYYQVDNSGTIISGKVSWNRKTIETRIKVDPVAGIKELEFGREAYRQI